MKKIFLKGFIASVAILSSVGYLSAAPTAIPTTDVSQEVSCEQFKSHGAKQGDQCFIEDRVYLGSNIKVTNFVDYYANMGDTPVVMFQRDKHGNAGFNTQFESLNGFQWVIDDKGDFFDLQGFKQDPKFGIYKVFPKRSKTLIMKSQPGKGIQPIKAPVGGNRETPSARVTFTTTTYNVSKSGDEIKISDTPQIHKEHIFFFTSWCGDGVVDREYGEEADDGANNGKPGYATLDCKKGKTPNPGVCDGASNGVQTSVAPTNLCKSGIPSVVTEHTDKFTWTCGGESADVGNATCEAPKPPKTEIPPVCDQTFHRELRYEQWKEMPIIFKDYFHNNSKSTYVLKDFSVLFRESDDMNTDGKSDFNNFRWSNGIYSGYKVAPGIKNLEIITADPGYYLNKPPKKRQKDNIYIEYKVNSGPEGKEAKPHTECISYEISWCGDGILDTQYGEKCDPNDPTKKGWVNGSCDPVTCEPKPEKPEIKIKKYADHKDAQDYSDALSVDYGKDFTYRYVVTASGSVDHKKATVTDRLPAAVKVKNIKAPAGWECKTGSVTENGKVRPTIVCQTPTMKANSTAEFTVNAQFVSEEEFKKLNYPEAVFTKGIRNISYVCTEEVTSIHPITKEVTKKVCAPDCTDPNDPKCTNDNPPPPECSTIPGHPHYDPACLMIPVKGEIKIKKYADHKDAQDYSDALSVDYGKDFTYRYVVTASATGDHKKATVTDKLPLAVKVKNIKAPAGWECKTGSVTEKGKAYPTIVCQTPLMKANSTAEFTVNAKFVSEEEFKKLDYPQTVFTKGIRNIAYVCTEEVTSVHPLTKEVTKKVCAPDCTDPNDPKCTEENPPHHECSTIPGHPHYDPACLSIPTKPEINIKKYADHKDGQTFSDALSVDYGKDFTYRYVVSSSGTTDLTKATVTDKLPLGVKVTGFKTIPNGWTCKHGSITENGKTYATAICQTPTMKANTSVEIVVNAQLVSDTEFLALNLPKEVFTQGLRNIAYVCTEEVKSVHPFTGVVTTKVCAPDCTDPNDPSCLPPPPPPVCSTIPGHPHYDPACVSVPTPPSYLTMMCVDNSVIVTKQYQTEQICNSERASYGQYAINKCYPKTIDQNSSELQKEIKRLEELCKKPEVTPPPPYCGDGILQPEEQCDPGTGRGPNLRTAASGTDLCSATCELPVRTATTPGENPIEFSIKIPTFSKVNIGVNNAGGKRTLTFDQYGLTVGRNSPIFSYGDEIILGFNPKYTVPTQISGDSEFTIKMDEKIGSAKAVTANPKNLKKLPYWEANGKKWYVINHGDLLVPVGAVVKNMECGASGRQYMRCEVKSNNSDEIKLFDGHELKGFEAGNTSGQKGRVTLFKGDADLASFQVTVEKSLVSAKGSSVSRKLEYITKAGDNFVAKITQNNTTNTTTTATNNFPFGPSVTTQAKPIDANIRNIGNATIRSAADLEQYKYNGNPNIYAIKGDVIIERPIEMKGVKTVLVEGKLTFNANTYYAQNDNNSSWAFITRGKTGEIQINSNVTHIAGVLMSINDTNLSDATGKIVADKSTSTILRIDGTVYGYAQDLFNKRTYVRKGTNHETDTTGTIITYSNRALRNPPPLLSQYLNAYKVKRLVR